jgi:hypothetical protein
MEDNKLHGAQLASCLALPVEEREHATLAAHPALNTLACFKAAAFVARGFSTFFGAP